MLVRRSHLAPSIVHTPVWILMTIPVMSNFWPDVVLASVLFSLAKPVVAAPRVAMIAMQMRILVFMVVTLFVVRLRPGAEKQLRGDRKRGYGGGGVPLFLVRERI